MNKATQTISNLVGLYVSAEILWTFIKPSEPHLYELAMEGIGKLQVRERVEYRLAVLSTLKSIRRLPEHDA